MSWPEYKKKREFRILEFVYGSLDDMIVLEFERPDFLISQNDVQSPFGVEVVEHHHSESLARLDKIYGYFTELIKGGDFRHKDDKTILEVGDFKVFSPEGSPKGEMKGILVKSRPIRDAVREICNLIQRKETLLPCYLEKARHVNLIIFDNEHFLSPLAEDIYWKILSQPYLKDVIYKTKFREIFLVSAIKDQRWLSIGLRKMLLLEDAFRFPAIVLDKALPKFQSKTIKKWLKDLNSFQELMPYFSAYLRNKGATVNIGEINNLKVAGYGSSLMALDDDSHSMFWIEDNPDDAFEKDTDLSSCDWLLNDDVFLERARVVEETYGFDTALIDDVQRTVTFSDVGVSE